MARPYFVACAGQFVLVFVCSARIGTPRFICSQSGTSSDKSLPPASKPAEQPSLHLIRPTHTYSLARLPRVSGCPMARAHPSLLARIGSSFRRKIL